MLVSDDGTIKMVAQNEFPIPADHLDEMGWWNLNEIHKTYVEDSVLKRLPCFESNPAAAEATASLRQDVINAFFDIGGVHMQIGKAYPYRKSLRPESWRVIQAVKDAVDPTHRVNPGSLGLE